MNITWQAPLELRELHVYDPLSMFPKSTGQMKNIEKIVVTCMSDLIHLKTLPKEFCHLSSLQYLHLRCPNMKSLFDSFGFLTNLQHLSLSRYSSLHELLNSFRNLIRLKYLNLEYCSNLTLLEETFANIRMLEYLNLSDCKSMELLPRQVSHQLSLEIVWFRVNQIPQTVSRNLITQIFEPYEFFVWFWFPNMIEITEDINHPNSLHLSYYLQLIYEQTVKQQIKKTKKRVFLFQVAKN